MGQDSTTIMSNQLLRATSTAGLSKLTTVNCHLDTNTVHDPERYRDLGVWVNNTPHQTPLLIESCDLGNFISLTTAPTAPMAAI